VKNLRPLLMLLVITLFVGRALVQTAVSIASKDATVKELPTQENAPVDVRVTQSDVPMEAPISGQLSLALLSESHSAK
jgi:hypothetical protein